MSKATERAANFFAAHADNQRTQIKMLQVARKLFQKTKPPGAFAERLENDAIAAILCLQHANGDFEGVTTELIENLPPREMEIIASAALRLCRKPGFSSELFNGDPTDLINQAYEDERKRW